MNDAEARAWDARELILKKIRELYPQEYAQALREVEDEERRIRVRLRGDPKSRRKKP